MNTVNITIDIPDCIDLQHFERVVLDTTAYSHNVTIEEYDFIRHILSKLTKE